MRIYQLVSQPAFSAVSNLLKADLKMKHVKALSNFGERMEKERALAQKVQEKYKEQIDAGDEEKKQEWTDYLNQEIDVQKLPSDVLDKVDTMKTEDYLVLKNFIEEPIEKTPLHAV